MSQYLETLGTPLPAIFAVAGFLALAFLVGWPLLRRLADFEPGEKAFLALTLGMDLLVLATIPLAWTPILRTPIPGALLTAGILGFLLFLVYHRRRPSLRTFPWHALPFLAFALLLLRNAVCYPFSWDDLTYQIAVPWRWYQAGSLGVFADNPYSAFPGAFSIANLLLVSVGGIMAPQVFNVALWLILSLRTYALVRHNAPGWLALPAAMSFAFSLSMIMVATAAYAELFLLLQVAGIVSVLDRILPRGRVEYRELALLGLFAALAASVKLTGLIVLAGTVCLLVTWQARNATEPAAQARGFGSRLGRFLAFLLPAVLVTAIFYARPTLATGNPFYPYFAEWFTDREATLATSEYHHDAGRDKFGPLVDSPEQQALYFVLTPILLAVDEGPFSEGLTFDGWFGMQYILHSLAIAWVVVAWIRGRLRDVRPLAWLGLTLAFYVFWCFTSRQARFLIPAYFLLTVSSSFAFPQVYRFVRVAAAVLFLPLTFLSIPVRIYSHLILSWGIMTGSITLESYLYSATQDGYMRACDKIMRSVPSQGTRILLLLEHRTLYVPRPAIIGTPYFQEHLFTPPDHPGSEQDLLDVLKREKITHVLIAWNNKDPDRMDKYLTLLAPFTRQLNELIRTGRLETIWHEEGYGLYRVQGERGASAP